MAGLTLDSGALVALERNSAYVYALLQVNREQGGAVRVPAGVVAQVWRSGRQARVAKLLKAEETTVVVLDEQKARAVGALCGAAGTADVVDASVAVCAAQHGDTVVTSDPDDIARLAPKLRVYEV
jgi:predicted nucleic acid-binding protein